MQFNLSQWQRQLPCAQAQTNPTAEPQTVDNQTQPVLTNATTHTGTTTTRPTTSKRH